MDHCGTVMIAQTCLKNFSWKNLRRGATHIASKWRLFLDSCKRSLKAVLLHNGSIKSSVPVARSLHLKESCKSIAILFTAIQFNEYRWYLCGDPEGREHFNRMEDSRNTSAFFAHGK